MVFDQMSFSQTSTIQMPINQNPTCHNVSWQNAFQFKIQLALRSLIRVLMSQKPVYQNAIFQNVFRPKVV
jgi:hypothetical protein